MGKAILFIAVSTLAGACIGMNLDPLLGTRPVLKIAGAIIGLFVSAIYFHGKKKK